MSELTREQAVEIWRDKLKAAGSSYWAGSDPTDVTIAAISTAYALGRQDALKEQPGESHE